MRTSKTITISENGHEYKYILTKMPALGLQRWTTRALAALIETGVLNQEAASDDFMTNLKTLFTSASGDILQSLAKVNCDKVDALLIELMNKTAERLVGNNKIAVTDADLGNTLENIGSLLELEKECFLLNFPIFAAGDLSSFQPSQQTAANTTRPPISIRNSRS